MHIAAMESALECMENYPPGFGGNWGYGPVTGYSEEAMVNNTYEELWDYG